MKWLLLAAPIYLLAASVSCDSQSISPAEDSGSGVVDSIVDFADSPDVFVHDITMADQQPPPPPTLLAGAASVEITPEIGVPLAGYGAEPRRVLNIGTIAAHLAALAGNCFDPSPGDVASLFAPSEGTHDPLTAKALVLDNGVTKMALIKLDTVGVSRQIRDELEAAAISLNIPRGQLVVAASHTHSGPGAVTDNLLWELIATDCFDQGTYTTLIEKTIEALTLANNNLRPARLGIGATDEINVSANRSGRPGVYDPQFGLIKITERDSDVAIAAVMNFAIHGTCLSATDLLFSADLMGPAEKALESKLGAGVAIFTNGAEGDVRPIHSGYSGAEIIGNILAATGKQLWDSVTTEPWIEIAGTLEDVLMPSAVLNGCLPLFGSDSTICDVLPGVINIPIDTWMAKELPFGALRLGDVAFATVPGEPITDIGFAIKAQGAQLGFRYTFVIGLANEHMGYITTEAEYHRGELEGQSTLYGPQTGKVAVDAISERLKALVP